MSIGDEIKNVLASILTSSEVCNAINNVLSNRLSTTSAPTIHVSPTPGQNTQANSRSTRMSVISSRIQEMFPSIPSTSRGIRQSRRQTRIASGAGTSSTSFEKEVFLVKRKACEDTLKRREKFEAFKDGYAKPAVKFYSDWNIDEIKQHIQEVFASKLINTDFDLLMPVSGYLSKIETDQLTGTRLKTLLRQKPLYLRPYVDLIQEDIEIVLERHYNEDDFLIDNFSYDVTEVDVPLNDNSFSLELKELQNRITENVTYFNVNRENIFVTCKLALQRKSFNAFNRLSVNFVDLEENSEGAIDGGGPSAEMFRLCMSYFHSSCLFEGSDQSKNMTYSIEQLNANNYFYCGQLIGMSILHGFGGPNFLSKTLLDFLSYGIDNMNPTMDDVPEGNLKSILQKINDCNDLAALQNIILEEDMIAISGWSFINNLTEKEKIIADVCKFHMCHRVRPALEQFKNGFQTCNMDTLMHKYPFEMQALLTFVPSNLNFSKMKELFTPVLNPIGSNLRTVENRVLAHYYNFVADSEADDLEVTLKELLIFTTGCSTIPPLGFKHTPTLEFLHQSDKIYPEASTCALVLKLPVVHTDYETFKHHMAFGVKNGAVFGLQ